MGYRGLCLLLLLTSYSLAQERTDSEQTPCLLASRFKVNKRYMYQYTTESRNGGVGAANLWNGPKVSCQVEIEIPQMCKFIMHTRGCVLSEVSVDPQGQPGDTQSPGSDAFQAAMEKNPLKFTVEDATSVQLYPETDEPVNILNIKRGIVSTLIVPDMKDEENGLMHRPLSKLITSTHVCNYQFDNKGKHITRAVCKENHIYHPFFHEDSGMSSEVTQDLSFQSSRRISNKLFDVNPSQSKPLHFEDPEDKAPDHMKDTVLSTLRDLVALPGTDQGQKRTSLFHKLVSSLRVLRSETLSQTVTEMLDLSGWLTYQSLFQCGTPECTSAILQAVRTIDGVSLEVDALVYGLSLQPNPDAARVRDMLSMAQYKQSKAIMYALANTVKKFHKGEVTPVVTDVAKFMETLLNGCSAEGLDNDSDFPVDHDELSLLVLRVVGVMAQAMQDVSPSLMASLFQCAKKTDIPVFGLFKEVYQDIQSPVEKRIAAYLLLMKKPHPHVVEKIVNSLENLENEELKSFVISHLNNIYESDDPQMYKLREELKEVSDGMSHNYKINSPVGSVQSNIIFDGRDTLPKEVMLETTLKVFGYNYDIFELTMEGTGFQPTIDALFGERGFFPDAISSVMYKAEDNAQMLKDILYRITTDTDRRKRQIAQDLMEDITNRAQRLMDDIRFSEAPEAIAYLRLLGNEIGYLKTSEMRKMAETLFMYYHVFIRTLPMKAFFSLISSTENEVFAHYIFMESAFSLPTASGFPLKFSLAGVFAPGAKGGLTRSGQHITADLSFMPSVGLEFVTHMGVHIPDYVEAGLEMHTNMYHESSVNAKININSNQLRVSIPAPKSNTQLLSISNRLVSVSSGQTKTVPSLVEDGTDSTDCQPLISGLKLCTIMRNSNSNSMDQTPSGETKFAVEIQPTGEISEYTATFTSETLREGKRGRNKVQSLKLALKAEGDDSTETTASMKYHYNKNILTTEVVIPDYDVEAGIKLALTDGDTEGNKIRGITIDVTNKNIPQLTFVGRTSDSLFRYQFNKDKMAISLPLPLGGKKLEELNIPTTLSTPRIDLSVIDLHVPSKVYPLPSITIPPSLDFSLPLLGLIEVSTKINSNFYNWEGSVSGGNNTGDFPSYIMQYKSMAQSPFNLLSYKYEGTGMMSGRADDNLKYLLNCSFSHSLIDTSFSALETLTVTNKLNAKANYKLEASSPVGLQASIYYSAQSTSTLNSDEVSGDGTMKGLFNIGPLYTNTSYTHSYYLRPLDHEGRGESTLHFDSPFIQVHNMIHGVYANSELNIVSRTNAQRDIFKHVAELKYKDAQLTLKCHATATGMDTILSNKVEFGVSNHMAILAIESQADYDTNKVFSLITGSLDSNGLGVNSEGSLTFDTMRGLHKASLGVGRNGLTTSGINSILCSSVTVENIFNGAIDNNGASISSLTKGMTAESRGEINIEGKVTPAEASLNGVFKGHAYDATAGHDVSIALNHRALTFSSNTMGTLKQMKMENSHALTLTLWTLTLLSKTNCLVCEDVYYKQDTKLNMKPFLMSLGTTNDLKYNDIILKNEGHVKLEPFKVHLSGSMNGGYGDEVNIINTCELTCDEMAGTMKHSVSGDVMGTKLRHNCELQFAGLSSTSNCETQVESEPLRFDSTIRTMALPFSFTVDAVVNTFTINLNKLQEISIPARISIPEFTIFNSYTIPAFTIDFDEIKSKIVAIIDDIKEFEIKMPDPEEIFGDLKVLYLSELPDFLFPGITLSEIKFPAINIPKLNLDNFRITMLAIPETKLPEIPSDVCIPVLGQIHGEFRINFPQYTFVTIGKIGNATVSPKNPQFKATLMSFVRSPIEPLRYTFDAAFQVASPIYNVSTTASLEKKDSSLITLLDSNCKSYMTFLEYDLTASATLGYDNGVNLNGKCNLIHNDANINLLQVSTQNTRESHHILTADITSQTFTDVNLRFASRKDGITASVSSPSTGFLGFQFQQRSPSQLYGKLFSRSLSAPEKDTDVFTAKATLRNSQRLILHTSWNWDFLHDVIEGTKDRIPAMTIAVLKFINKYHVAHFGFDLNRGGIKLKNTVSNFVERVYQGVLMYCNTLQSAVKRLAEQSRNMYIEASDSLMSMSVRNSAESNFSSCIQDEGVSEAILTKSDVSKWEVLFDIM
ncbi:hypothetical protein INR49_014226, partial [Caranx melampygus]